MGNWFKNKHIFEVISEMPLLPQSSTSAVHLLLPIETLQQEFFVKFCFNALYYSGDYLQANVKKRFKMLFSYEKIMSIVLLTSFRENLHEKKQ